MYRYDSYGHLYLKWVGIYYGERWIHSISVNQTKGSRLMASLHARRTLSPSGSGGFIYSSRKLALVSVIGIIERLEHMCYYVSAI